MSYSSAWFGAPEEDLADAQRRKIDGILDMAHVKSGMHVLEIGTGWGGLAARAAERGARVTTLTISAEQARLAEDRIAQAGVADRVQVLLRDYREAQGSDAVVSVEMIEAVGERYWPTYFTALDRLLKPGGRVGLQSIMMPHDRMLASRGDYSWMHKYVQGELLKLGHRVGTRRSAKRPGRDRPEVTDRMLILWVVSLLTPTGPGPCVVVSRSARSAWPEWRRWFSRAIRTTSAATTSLIGGRPGRFG